MNKDIDAKCSDGAPHRLRRRLAPSLLIADRCGRLAASHCLSPALSGPHRSAVRCNRRLPRATTGEMIRGESIPRADYAGSKNIPLWRRTLLSAVHRFIGARAEMSWRCGVRACVTASPPASLLLSPLQSASSGLRGDAAGESGAEVGEGVALDLAVGFFSGAELGDGAHFA